MDPLGIGSLIDQMQSKYGPRLENATKEMAALRQDIQGLRADIRELTNVLRQSKKYIHD